MPIYEFRCAACGRISEYLFLSRAEEATPVCRRCGSPEMTRVLSRVRVRLSEETRLERLADPARFRDLDENDPRSVAKMLKMLGPELGEDFEGDVDEMVEEALAAEEGEGDGLTGEEELD